MIKRLPSRNQRSKGVRVKHVLQICLLLGVCFWLIYQVKHSHDKKKEFDEKDAKASVKAQSDDEILKLGRKDLPQLQDATKNEKHEEEEEDAVEEEENKPEEEQKEIRMHDEEDQEEANKHEEEREDEGIRHEDEEQEETNKQQEEQEEEASKHEEEEQEEETKNEEIEDERRGVEDDETDEQDQERTEGEADREDEFLDEEKDREGDGDDRENKGEGDGKENEDDGDDKESEGNRGEEKDSQVEKENSLDDNDNDGDRNAHVAREEHYKADDASSAVSHDNQITITETDKVSLDNPNENSERNMLQEENKSNHTEKMNGNQGNMELKSGEGEMAKSGNLLNVTAAEENDHGTKLDNPDNSLLLNARNNLTDISNNSTGLSTEITVASLQNRTQTLLDSNEDQNATVDGATNLEAVNLQTTGMEKANNPTTVSNGNQSDPNSTISIKTMKTDAASGDSFNNSKPVLSEKVISSNGTADGDVSSGSLVIKETIDSTQNETLNRDGESGETNEASHSSLTDGTGDGHSDRESIETNESMNGTVDATKEDTIDSSESSIIQDEKESQIDLDTLPDIRADVGNNEDVAVE